MEEVLSMIKNTENAKHHCILSILYGTGMKLSELVNLKMKNIDLNSKMIHICLGEDCYSILPETLYRYITQIKKLKKDNTYLFTNNRGKKMNKRSIQKIVSKATKRMHINKHVASKNINSIKNPLDI